MSLRRARLIAALFTLLLGVQSVGVVAPAHADEAARARFHFERGLRLYRQGRLEGAVREFILVRQITKSPQPLFNLAVCFDQLGASDKAFFYFAAYLRATEATPDQARLARQALERLRKRVGVLVLRTEPPGAEVYIDRREHGSYGVTPLTVPVAAGARTVWLQKEGYRGAEVVVRAALGREVERTIALEPIVGRLEVAAEPAGDVLVLDLSGATVARGPSPLRADLRPGSYVVEVSTAGHRSSKEVIRIRAEEETRHRPRLEPLPPPTGTLTVTSNRLGALIEVDGRAVGFTPAVLRDLPLGPRDVRVTYADNQPWSGPVDVRAEQPGYLTATLEPPPETRRWDGTWVIGGVGATALAAAAVTGFLALDARSEYQERRSNPNGSDIRDLRAQGLALAQAADGLLITGAVALGAAIILFFATEEEDPRRSRASLSWE